MVFRINFITQREKQLKFYEIVAIATLIYECETWTILQKDISEIQTSEMKFLRAVKGCSLRDRLHNDDIRKDLKLPVSYTHLDVYKRQSRSRSRFTNSTFFTR